MLFVGHSFITFTNNRADRGEAAAFSESNVIIEENSSVHFNSNSALYSSGGAFVCSNNSNVTIKGSFNVTFNGNKAIQNGGAILSSNVYQIVFEENSMLYFTNNRLIVQEIMVVLSLTFQKGKSKVIFETNTADNGGAFFFTNSAITFKEVS